MRRATALGLLLAAVLLQGCGRQETRTVVVSGGRIDPALAASAPASAAPAAPAVVISVPDAPSPPAAPPNASEPVAGPPAGVASQPQEPRGPDGPALLALRPLVLPVEGVRPSDLVDTFAQQRAGSRHEAIDIAAPRGTRVVAVDDGRVVKLFNSKPGGLTVYQFDPEDNLAYYYAHLDRYAEGLAEGKVLRRGDLVGYVGVTGNSAADAPHLHFAVFRLGPQKQWWKGEAVNPYPALRLAQPAR